MKAFLLLALVSCYAVSSVVGTRFVCYFPNWTFYRQGDGNFKVANIDPQLCTDLVYAFAKLDGNTYKIASYDPWVDIDNKGYTDFVGLKAKNSKLKTTIAIGGWNDSQDGSKKYSIMVADPAKRKIFIDSVVAFLQLYKFDGIDFDWEYPLSPSDKAGFAELLKELRTALGMSTIISAAVSFNQTIIDLGYDVPIIEQTVDYINLMAYDMHGSWEPQTDHHAPLHRRSEETVEINANLSVSYWLQRGLSPDKLNLGIPLYGRTWTLGFSVEPEPQALTAGPGPAGPYTREPGTLGYYEICESIHDGSWETVEDPEHLNGPYAFSISSPKGWVGYDDITMAAVKSQYVLDNKLGGAMVWDMSTDDFHNICGDGPNPMMTTISEMVVDKGSRFVCYFPNWAVYRQRNGYYSVDNINASLCTDLIYSFAILNKNTNQIQIMDYTTDITNGQYAKFVALKEQNPNLKTTIAIGGWLDSHDGSNKYSYMVASKDNRTIFIQSVLKFVDDYKFDGLDLDWEYPGTLPTDKTGFGELLRELKDAFTEKQYLLSVAVSANKTVIDLGYDVEVMAEAADYINIMAYDMHGPWEPLTDHHAPLYNRSWDTDNTNNVDFIVKYWQEKGLPASKINLGIPLYGKSWTLNYTYTSDPTLPAPGLGGGAAGPFTQQSGFLGYNEICLKVKSSSWNVVVDPDHLIGPYASSPEIPMTWVSYDDPDMASVKTRYVLDMKLGGAIVWDLSTDDFRDRCGTGANPITSIISRTLFDVTDSTTTASTTLTASSTVKTTATNPLTDQTTVSTSVSSSTTQFSTTTSSSTEAITESTSASTTMTPSSTRDGTGSTTRPPTTKRTTMSVSTTQATTTIPTTTFATESTTESGNVFRTTPLSQSLLLTFFFIFMFLTRLH